MGGNYQEIESEINTLLTNLAGCKVPVEFAYPRAVNLARALVETSTSTFPLMYWTHSACHLFENFPHVPSFLQDEKLFPAAEIIVDGMVKGVIDGLTTRKFEREPLGCVDRLVGGILRYNTQNASLDSINYPFKPTSLERPEFVKMVEQDKYARSILPFIKTKSILEMAEEVVRTQSPAELENYLTDHKFIELLPELRLRLSEQDLESALEVYSASNKEHAKGTNTTIIGGKNILLRFNKLEAVTTALDGVYIDVDGTLIEQNVCTGHELLSNIVHAYAISRLSEGKRVVIMSGGDPAEQTAKLKSLGVDERLLPVIAKSTLKGKKLEICVDDTHPFWQGFASEQYIHPTQDNAKLRDGASGD